MFSNLSGSQRLVLYDALIHAIMTNSGIGFHNSDQGHPAYRMGASGEVDHHAWGDSPENNELFQMIAALASELGGSACHPIRTWEEFCRVAVERYKQSKSNA